MEIIKNVDYQKLKEISQKITIEKPEKISSYILNNNIYIDENESCSEYEDDYLNDVQIDSNDENHPKNDYPSTPEDSSNYDEQEDYWRDESEEEEDDVDFEGDANESHLKRLYQNLGKSRRKQHNEYHEDYGYKNTAYDFWYHNEE